MSDLLLNKYLSSMSAAMILSLSLICLVLPHIKIDRNLLPKKSKIVKYVPGISKNVWKPILFFLIINIFIYSIFLLHDLYKTAITSTWFIAFIMLICWCLLYTIFGFMLMLDYIERAYNVWNFRAIMILLIFLALIHYVHPTTPIYEYYFLGLYTIICIILAIMMSLIINEFRYYIIN